MELALLKEVAGLGGAANPLGGVETAAPVETDRWIEGGGTPREDRAGLPGGGGIPVVEGGRLLGGGIIGDALAAGGGAALLPLAVLLGGPEARGGGGVARAAVALLGSFLLTHFFRSLS
jgi:hypothetical protein